ncbi:MAG: GNAT family N-acetyltransferase [Pseudorhodoplanes sp.]|nr:GNAT family N-acetyltransferase [Pseudorhodoplanes sp.]
MKTLIAWLRRLFTGAEPLITDASATDAAAIGRLHGASFRRGWSDDEIERLLLDKSVIAHRVTVGRAFAGFIVSRIAAGEAEILSIAVAAPRQGKGLAGRLLRHHLGRLAAIAVHAVFLEVDEDNTPAIRLYRRAGFREVGRRAGYYPSPGGKPSNALILRRDLV